MSDLTGMTIGRRRRASGLLHQVGTASQTLDLLSIRPHPQQPRQLLDEAHKQRLIAGEEPTAVLRSWLEANPNSPSAQELLTLAHSIKVMGLIHPICVYPAEDGTAQWWTAPGERRWWAHVYALGQGWQLPTGSPAQIATTQLPQGVSLEAVQLAENLHRDALSLWETAVGLQTLYDRYGKWAEVEELMGLSKNYRIRLMQIMKLAPAVQQLAQQWRLTERHIRPLTKGVFKEDVALQTAVCQELETTLHHLKAEATANGESFTLPSYTIVEQIAQTHLPASALSVDELQDDKPMVEEEAVSAFDEWGETAVSTTSVNPTDTADDFASVAMPEESEIRPQENAPSFQPENQSSSQTLHQFRQEIDRLDKQIAAWQEADWQHIQQRLATDDPLRQQVETIHAWLDELLR